MYKITEHDSIKRQSDGASLPKTPGNRDYQQFLEDIKEYGSGIVEGADIVEPDYVALRTGPEGYLPIPDQMDILTKDGFTALQAVNQAVKDKYPKTITGGISIAPLPEWVLVIGKEA